MLTQAENELLCRVEGDAPMGQIMRRHWLPACLIEEVEEPDCDPVKVRLCGTDLVVFRDTNGKLGVLDELCPHRRASLVYGRNEECGIRCLYHGWKFDVDGNARFIDRVALAQAASVATFSDDGAAGAIAYARLQRDGNHIDTISNIVTTSYSTVGAITRSDATSIAAYDKSRKFIDAPTIPNGKTASACSAYALRLGKDPATRVPTLVAPMRLDTGDNEADKLLGLELGDIVTVERTPGGVGSQVVKRLVVQGISHQIDLEQWWVTLYLSPAPPAATDVPYMELGDATYGRLGAAYGNALIY